ncbi:MAG: hypothetical protein H6739_03705 [Alphaproteobacteria bacterium]|nr:hypothetical protein [Alphaproteobacteria bacterium]
MIWLALLACKGAPFDSGLACTDIGCIDGLEIRFETDGWPAGRYVVALDLDGATETCTATLPFGDSPDDGCDGEASLSLIGTRLPAAQQAIGGVWLTRTDLSAVGLTLSRDDAVLVETTLTPEYETLAPNGEACGPVCRYASEAVVVP